jgi:hypothetical protein
MSIAKSVSYDQTEILGWIRELHCNGRFDVDATFGNGSFYKSPSEWPTHRFDLDDSLSNCVTASSDNLPLMPNSAGSIVFDPPFLTYVRSGREGNGKMIMARRFAGYWTYGELQDHYCASLACFSRVLRPKGVVVFKCQDIIHNHRMHCTHVNVIEWASALGFRLKDLFVLPAKHRPPSPNRKGKQKHARVFHSYFLVLELA